VSQEQQNQNVNTGENDSTQDTGGFPSPPTQPEQSKKLKKQKSSKKKSWNKCTTISIIAAVIMITAAVVAKMTGVMYFGFKSPDQQVALRSVACGDDIIEDFSRIMAYQALEPNIFVSIADRVRNIDNYRNDVNCVFIMAANATTTDNSTDLEKYLNDLDNFSNQGLYPSNRVRIFGLESNSMKGLKDALFRESFDPELVMGI